MDSYSAFSKWYDEFMEEVPYDEWCEFICGLLKKDGIEDGIICELGSGTGNMTERMALKGYDMIGIDLSPEMLAVAEQKKALSGDESVEKILYLCQDMRDLELFGTVAAVYSSFDSVNYILEDDEIIETFRLVNNYLDPKGLFIFDFNTKLNYMNLADSPAGSDVIGDVTYVWNNCFDEESLINEHELTMFVPEEGEENLYRKYSEFHYQRGYTLEEIKEFIKESGMIFEAAFDGYEFGEATEESTRIFVVARESGKKFYG